MGKTIADQIEEFSETYGRVLAVGDTKWRYYRLGTGPVLFWLTGGLRRAAYGFAFMERLAPRWTVIAPDYPPLQKIAPMMAGLEAILCAEGVERCTVGGQSYGGILAQVLLALKPELVDCLLLSSTGPADYGPAWGPIDSFFASLARILPERSVKNLLGRGLEKALSVPEAERAEWREAVRNTLDRDLTRWDFASHFAVAADVFRQRIVRPQVFAGWPGRVVVLSSENDPTQGKGDRARYMKLFGRPPEWVSMGPMGHTAALSDPERYVEALEQALA